MTDIIGACRLKISYAMREVMKMDDRFIAERITALRLKKNVSEYRMSLELGQSKSYVQGITSGKAYPSVKQLYNICDYFGITLAEFFDEETDDPQRMHTVLALAKQLSPADLDRVIDLMGRLSER